MKTIIIVGFFIVALFFAINAREKLFLDVKIAIATHLCDMQGKEFSSVNGVTFISYTCGARKIQKSNERP